MCYMNKEGTNRPFSWWGSWISERWSEAPNFTARKYKIQKDGLKVFFHFFMLLTNFTDNKTLKTKDIAFKNTKCWTVVYKMEQ